MFTVFTYIVYFGIFASALYAVFYSFAARRSKDESRKFHFTAKNNIAMGIMLVLLSVIQLFFFEKAGEGSTIRVLVGATFLLLGLFNIFAGIRNRKIAILKAKK
jgi:hypothetical protein